MQHAARAFDDRSVECRTLRILLVEDNELNQYVANAFLSKLGHVVRIANDGQEAVDTYVQGDQDVVLMDLQMPRMDGFEATKHIRQIIGDCETPIIAVTAGAAGISVDDAISIGMNGYMLKPVDWDALNNLMSNVAAT